MKFLSMLMLVSSIYAAYKNQPLWAILFGVYGLFYRMEVRNARNH